MADGNRLRNEILAYFHQNPSRPIRTVELTRKLRREKRTVNYHLYALQRQGAIRKVVVSPPTWCLETANPAIRYVLPPDAQEIGWEGEVEASLNGETQDSPTAADQTGLSMHDVNNKILQSLSAQGAMGATDLAKALGFHSKKDVNPYLYELQLKGLIKKVQESPPLWEAADTPDILLERLNDLSFNDRGSDLGPAMGLDPGVLAQRLLTRLGELERPIEVDQLALDVGLRSKKDINPVLYSLLRQGRVQKVQDVPPMWSLNLDFSGTKTPTTTRPSSESNGLEASGGEGESSVDENGEASTSQSMGRTASTASLNSVQSQSKLDSGSENGCITSAQVTGSNGDSMASTNSVQTPSSSSPSSTTSSTTTTTTTATAAAAATTVTAATTNTTTTTTTTATPTSTAGPTAAAADLSPTYSDQEMREMVLDHMGKSQKKTVSAMEMARAFGLPNKKAVNRALYYLKRQGLVSKVSIKPALWSLGNVAPTTPLNTLHPFSETEINSIEEMRDNSTGLSAFQSSGKEMLSTNPFFQQLQKIANRDPENAKAEAANQIKDGLLSSVFQTGTDDENGRTIMNPLTLNSDEPGTLENMAAILNSDTFAALNKNPISAFMEYAQSRHLEGKIEIVCCTGPSHNPRFQAAAFLGTQAFPPVWDKTKKEAKRKAADVAIRMLNAQGAYQLPVQTKNATRPTDVTPTTTMFDLVAALSHQAYNEKVVSIPEPMLAGRKVLAAMVMKMGDEAGTVISMGTGNRCISGERLSQEGLVVNDSHAEIVTRRGFLRFLYKQLIDYDESESNSILEPTSEPGKFRIKPHITFHLYISTAPCGDGALFSKTDTRVGDNSGDDEDEHHPTFSTDLQGLLRTKMEGGEGTIPIEPDFTTQTWDGIMRGDQRLRTMSCSDKIARWNVLGLQGSLLSHFVEPIYLNSVTLGYLYDHGHLSRAVCCRLNGEPEFNSLLPVGFHLNHPHLGRVSIYDPPRETEKTKPHSLNWCLGDQRLELTDGTKGQCVMRVEQKSQSQVCKSALFASFKEACVKHKRTDLMAFSNYYVVKTAATEFQKAKKILMERFKHKNRGTWIAKPMEEKMFS